MEEINREFVRHHAPQFRRMFGELLALGDGGFMINCAAGKDRTGFGAAMILAALGVAEDDIVADYLLSDRYFPIEREMARVLRKYGGEAGGRLDPALIRPMMETRREYIAAALEAIRRDYGSLERFLGGGDGCRSGGAARAARALHRLAVQDNQRPTGVFQRKFMSFFMPSAFFWV